jgi:cytochrome c oxidase subunit 2
VPEAGAQGGRLDVRVEGRQFFWQFEYPNGVLTVDRLRAPAGRPVQMEITAPEHDVNHSWWIPALGGKMDAIPGQTTEYWFQAESPGIYRGQCAEFCGVQHARMAAYVDVLPAAEFDAWMREERRRQATGRSTLGAETFQAACAKCHGFEGEGGIGPGLRDNPQVSDRRALIEIVVNGRNEMPAVGKALPAHQLSALARHMRSEFGQGGGGGG